MAAFTCASRLPSGPSTFVPRLSSPFDPSTSTNCVQDSDCGSSSGLGGMKTQELASDEGGSCSSSGPGAGVPPPHPAAYYPRPTALPHSNGPVPLVPPPGPGVLPAWVHPVPPGGSTDLFVHIQPGETLSIWVGNEPQNINGPATIRMIGENGFAPSTIPFDVPPGHQVHQIVDETGVLRHIILSPEPMHPVRCPPPRSQASSGIGSRMTSPPQPGYPPTPFYTVNRKWQQNGPIPSSKIRHEHGPITAQRGEEEPTEVDMDSDEFYRLKDMLNRISSPTVKRVSATDADIGWQELDTSEAAAVGGPFPQIDASEFVYHIVLFEANGRMVASYRCETESGNTLRLLQLRPNTDYYVHSKASLEERGLFGEPSIPIFFKTNQGPPDPVLIPKLLFKTCDSLTIAWRPPLHDNGSSVVSYSVYLAKLSVNDDRREKVWEGTQCEARISRLMPSTAYRFRVTATNLIGESADSPPLVASTRSDAPLPAPHPPMIHPFGPRSLKITWISHPECTFSLDMQDITAGSGIMLFRDRIPGGFAQANDLIAGNEYRFRLQVHNMEGDSMKSEWAYFKMPVPRMERISLTQERNNGHILIPDRVLTPTKPMIIHHNKKKVEVAWKCPGAREREFIYHLQGATVNHPNKYRTLYNGPLSTFLNTEEDIMNMRVQAINKKGVASEYSEVLTIPREDENAIQKPVPVSTPVVVGVGKGGIKITWTLPQMKIPDSASLMFEVRRIDSTSEMVYSGSEMWCILSNLGNKQHIEVQVRAVVIANDGTRVEGDWSKVGGGCTPRDAPTPPTDLAINAEKTLLTWAAPEASSDLRYKVRCCELVDGQTVEEITSETADRKYSLIKLGYAKQYVCTITAHHDGGESGPSEELKFNTPAGSPAQPESMSIEADSISSLILKWATPDCRGAQIEQYRVRISCRGEIVKESCILAPSMEFCEYKITDLQPDTSYRVELSAENEVGAGGVAFITGTTKCLPPAPPKLEADAESTVLRLRWKAPETHTMVHYKILRLYDNGNQTSIYEGDQCTTKVKGLTESTAYRFQIRCSDRLTGIGPWSEIFSFTTAIAPPPAIKSPPTASSSGNGFYQIEWSPVIPKPNIRKCFYRLQAVDCSQDNARWHTVYDGQMPSFTLRATDYPSAIQSRVICVRPEGENEVMSTPSPVVYIANQPLERDDASVYNEDSSNGGSENPWKKYGNASGVLIENLMSVRFFLLVFFVLFSFSMALLFDHTFDLRSHNSLSPIGVPSMPIDNAPPPPPPN